MQAEQVATDKAAVQQELDLIAQRLKTAECGQEDLKLEREQWKTKCSRIQQVWHNKLIGIIKSFTVTRVSSKLDTRINLRLRNVLLGF